MSLLRALAVATCALAAAAAAAPAPDVSVEIFVASKCPDASRCENTFLPEVLATVGSIVDFRASFIGEANASAPVGASCLHGDQECLGNIAQLCIQRHFPASVDVGGLGKHSWTEFLACVGHFSHTSESEIPQNTDECLASLGVRATAMDRIHQCMDGPEGRAMLDASIQRTISLCGHHADGCLSCTMFLEGKRVCVEDDATWKNCTVGHDAGSWVRAICDAYTGDRKPAACGASLVAEVETGADVNGSAMLACTYAILLAAVSLAAALAAARARLPASPPGGGSRPLLCAAEGTQAAQGLA